MEYFVKFLFTDTKSDTPRGTELSISAVIVDPKLEKTGDDVKKADMSIRASRLRALKIHIKFASMYIDVDDGINSFSNYWEFQKLYSTYEYCYLMDTDFVRIYNGANLFDTLLPLLVELIDESPSEPDTETALEDWEQNWQSKEYFRLAS